MSDIANTSRFFQLSGPMLFEYEFNERFNDTRSDKYGKFSLGEFEPFVMRMLDGSFVYSDTRVSNKLTTNNFTCNTSLAYDKKPSWWFRYKGNSADYLNYADMNVNFGVLSEVNTRFVGNLYTSEDVTEESSMIETEVRYDELVSILKAACKLLYSEDELVICDPRIYETLKVSNALTALLKLCVDMRGEEYIFRYFDDDPESIPDKTITYKEAYENLLDDLSYYDYSIEYDEEGFPTAYHSNLYDRLKTKPGYEDWTLDVCIKFSERIVFSVSCEMYGFREKNQVAGYNTGSFYKYTTLDYSDPTIQEWVVKEYKRVENTNINTITTQDKIPFDTYRVYFVGGYFLDDIYGIRIRVSANNSNGNKVVLSDLMFSKESNVPYIYLVDQPMYVSNKIYDKYIEVKVPAMKYISTDYAKTLGGDEYKTLAEYLDIVEGSPVIVEFSCISNSEIKEYTGEEDEILDIARTLKNKPLIPQGMTAYIYQQSNTVSCSLAQTANSDNIGATISVPDGKNYVEFGGTWKGDPLTWGIIYQFNRVFPVYDVKTRRNVNYYEPDTSGETVEWVGYHEIVAKYYGQGGSVVDGYEAQPLYTQRYNFTQMFNPMQDGSELMQYRPIIKRSIKVAGEEVEISVFGVVFEYTFRLINVIDDVQFIKKASCYISSEDEGGVADFFNDTMILNLPVETFNVYNKIEEIKHTITGPSTNPVATKYTKVFYNTNSISLNADGSFYGSGTYSLQMSEAPRNYKFVFRKYDEDGNLTIYDMSDAAYRLYSRDASGRDIVIEPTYSGNMNAAMGEIEFNISINNIQKLKAVDPADRFMSIVVVNQDNTQYSMFDFTYE